MTDKRRRSIVDYLSLDEEQEQEETTQRIAQQVIPEDPTSRLMNAVGRVVQAELKVISIRVENIRERITELVNQLDEMKEAHTRCNHLMDDYRAKMTDEINNLKVKINDLRHYDVDKKAFETMHDELIKTTHTVEALRKWMYIIAAAAVGALLKSIMGMITNL